LITDLEQYENKENIINFIKNLDLLIDINLEKIDDPTLDQIDSFQNTVDKVIEFLLSCFKRKIDTILTDELIEDKDEYIESILYNTFYVNALVDFPKSSNIKEYRVKLFSREKSDELFEYTDEQLGSLETNKKR